MKRIFVKPLMLGVIILASMTACKKEVTPVVPPVVPEITVADLAGAYKVTAFMETDSASVEHDLFAEYYTSCVQDDVITLNTDMSSVRQDLGEACSPAGDSTSTWALASNIVTIEGEDFIVAHHDSLSLTLTSDTRFGRTASAYTTTFTKQ